MEQKEYSKEGIEWSFVEFPDNQVGFSFDAQLFVSLVLFAAKCQHHLVVYWSTEYVRIIVHFAVCVCVCVFFSVMHAELSVGA